MNDSTGSRRREVLRTALAIVATFLGILGVVGTATLAGGAGELLAPSQPPTRLDAEELVRRQQELLRYELELSEREAWLSQLQSELAVRAERLEPYEVYRTDRPVFQCDTLTETLATCRELLYLDNTISVAEGARSDAAQPDDPSLLGAQALLSRFDSLDDRLSAIERVVIVDPEGALETTLLRHDLDRLEEDVEELGDLGKWLIGLLVGAFGAILALAAREYIRPGTPPERPQDRKPQEPEQEQPPSKGANNARRRNPEQSRQ
jgi:hypothetical protein